MGAAITAGLGAGVFSSLEDLQKDSRNSTFYSPREGIFNKKDLNEWKKFLETLLEAYS